MLTSSVIIEQVGNMKSKKHLKVWAGLVLFICCSSFTCEREFQKLEAASVWEVTPTNIQVTNDSIAFSIKGEIPERLIGKHNGLLINLQLRETQNCRVQEIDQIRIEADNGKNTFDHRYKVPLELNEELLELQAYVFRLVGKEQVLRGGWPIKLTEIKTNTQPE